MKTIVFIFLMSATWQTGLAQKRLNYTLWADGLIEPQLAKSSLYAPGVGLRAEVSKRLQKPAYSLFIQAGYAHFFRKSSSAFVATIGLVTIGYHYQSKKAFWTSASVGAQYWSERMRLRFPDYAIDETVNSISPSATVGLGVRINSRYRLGIEYRGVFKPEVGTVVLRNTVALCLGYTF